VQGPTGVTGVQGPTGATGAQGPTGPSGQVWSVGSGLQLAGNTLSVGSVVYVGAELHAPFLFADSFAWNPAQCGAHNLQATDFQATLTAGASIVRFYDEFGSSADGGKIGAPVRPQNGALPAAFGCFFQSSVIGTGTAHVTANLWKIPVGATSPGSIISSVALSDAVATSAPVEVSNTVFTGGQLVTYNGSTGYNYLVEITFDRAYPSFKSTGCYLRWCADFITP